MANKLAKSGLFTKFGSIAFGAILLAVPVTVCAANNCPWMNEATASDLVGGDAVGAFVAGGAKLSVCTFTQHAGKMTRKLEIVIEIAADPHGRFNTLAKTCGSAGASLEAIGNEAVACPLDPSGKKLGERTLGRVRDQVFTITLSSSLRNDPVLNKNDLRNRISIAAEQVAGNLF